jgi:FK506-binding nuclear protein
MSMQPMAMFGLEVPCGDVMIPASSEIPSAFRITMAAIDPSAEPEGEDGAVPRATLKVIRQALLADEGMYDDDDDSSDDGFDKDEMERILAGEASDESGAEDDSEDDSEDEEVNGGPSDPTKSKKAKRAAAREKIRELLAEEGMDIDEADEDDDEEQINGVNGIVKSAKAMGKMPASDSDEDEDEDMDDDDDIEEYVICTLDPVKVCVNPEIA